MASRRNPVKRQDRTEPSRADLERQIAELQAQLARRADAAAAKPPRPARARGGTRVRGDVSVSQGHFIGGDYIEVVNQAVPPDEDAEAARLALGSYLHALATELAHVRLGEVDPGIDPTRQQPLELPDIYVPLDTTHQVPEKLSLAQALAAKEHGDEPMGGRDRPHDEKMRPVPALEALATHRQLTLLGAPGSGKSTFGAHVLLALAQAWRGEPAQLAAFGEAWPHGALLPLRVVLRRFAERWAGSGEPSAGDLWAFIGDDLRAGGWGNSSEAMRTVQRLARRHGALVLFDGLDECGDPARRQRVLAAVRRFITSEGEKSRFLLTARPYSFPEGPDPAQGVYQLADLGDEQIALFIRRWYDAVQRRGWPVDDPERRRDGLLAAVPRADLQPLVRNPLLLTLTATLHSNRGRLPEDRPDLYDETVQLLLDRWNKKAGSDRALLDLLAVSGLTLRGLRTALEKLAYEVHRDSSGSGEGAADIAEGRLVRAFAPLLGGSKDKADLVVEFIERRAGLLLGHGARDDGERQFGFPHRTFQEFLAACHLQDQPDFARRCRELADRDPGHWRVVLPLAARMAKPERGATAADELIGGVDASAARQRGTLVPAHWERALLAGLQLQELGVAQLAASERAAAVLDRVRSWLAASLPLHPSQGGAPAVTRARAGDTLAALGDPRFDAQRLCLPADEHLGFVRIAADPAFLIGTRRANRERVARIARVEEYELNDEAVAVPEFWIARYPVTVAQFRAFVAASAHPFAAKGAYGLRDPASRPMRMVSWHDAVAYCRWLHGEIAAHPALAVHPLAKLLRAGRLEVALPSELEWERAARGGLQGRVFSWGDDPDPERANMAGSGIDDTSAVGCFEANAFGLHDMLGNVWEWTRSTYAPQPPRADDLTGGERADDEASRSVRGGSWIDTHRLVRCALRDRFPPGYRGGLLGFRVVLRSPPVS